MVQTTIRAFGDIGRLFPKWCFGGTLLWSGIVVDETSCFPAMPKANNTQLSSVVSLQHGCASVIAAAFTAPAEMAHAFGSAYACGPASRGLQAHEGL
ncbi:hypothetical protein ACWCQK_11070 [Streptomyces sp. NPDC002306]